MAKKQFLTDLDIEGNVIISDDLTIPGVGSNAMAYPLGVDADYNVVKGRAIENPTYYVATRTELIDAYTDIRANYNGGDIHILGYIQLSSPLTFSDLTGIRFFGNNSGFKMTTSDSATASVHYIKISAGATSFTGVNFIACPICNPNVTYKGIPSRVFLRVGDLNVPMSSGIKIDFTSCKFGNIVGGFDPANSGDTANQPVIEIQAKPTAGIGLRITLDKCAISSNDGKTNSLRYRAFVIDNVATTVNIVSAHAPKITITSQLEADNSVEESSNAFGFSGNEYNTDPLDRISFTTDGSAYMLSDAYTIPETLARLNIFAVAPAAVSATMDDEIFILDKTTTIGGAQAKNILSIKLSDVLTPPATGLERVADTGWRLIGEDLTLHLPIGLHAIDFTEGYDTVDKVGASGYNAVAFGWGKALGASSLAIGYAEAAQDYAVAIGWNSKATDYGSVVIGGSSIVAGRYSLGVGDFVNINAGVGRALAVGDHIENNRSYSATFGKYNIGKLTSTFEIGAGIDADNRINIFEVDAKGVASTPLVTIADIDLATNKTLVTREYVTTGLNGSISSVVAGTNITVDATDPRNPVVSAVAGTAAGVLRRLYFLADEENINTVDYYKVLPGERGVLDSATQTKSVALQSKAYFDQDFITNSYTEVRVFPTGNYEGAVDIISAVAAQLRFTVEVYLTDIDGTPLDSGIVGAPVGDLGKEVIIILDSGIVAVEDADPVGVHVIATLMDEFAVAANHRIRFHVSTERTEPTGDATHDISVLSGSSHNTYIDVTVPINTDTVANKSNVPGATTTDALNSLFSGGAAVLTENVKVAGIGTIGAVSDGFEFLQGWDLTKVMQELVSKKVPPTYYQPTAGISAAPSATQEIGTTPIIYTLSPAFTQNDAGLMGEVRIYKETTLISTQIDLTAYAHSNQTVLQGLTSYKVEIDYAEGLTKNDSLGDSDPAGKVLAGTVEKSITVRGSYYNWYNEFGTVRPTTGQQVRDGSNGTFNNTFSISTGNTATVFVITIPVGKSIKEVWAIGGALPLNVTGNFILDSTVTKVPDGGGTDANYNMYVYENSIPYTNYTLNVTLQ